MKKTLFIILLVLSVVLAYGSAHALTGVCSGCHTMHNSQDGQNVATGDDGSTTTSTPNASLTISTCIGCHNGGVTSAPNIFGSTYGTNTTAGGTFNSSVADTNSKKHNVQDLVAAGMETDEDVNVTGTPGNGGDSTLTVGLTELTCAGAKGCHGDHSQTGSAAGIKGFHHASRTADRSSKGYRFLETSTGTPIEGKGSTQAGVDGWEINQPSSGLDVHNVYNADAGTSISTLCAQCHGEFHGTSDTGSSSPFQRHPTDNAIPVAWDSVGAGVTIDYQNNPFGFSGTDFTTKAINVAYADDLSDNPDVVCVSCHRAHGTPNNDLLRFDYSGMVAGGGGTTGCLGCHTNQR